MNAVTAAEKAAVLAYSIPRKTLKSGHEATVCIAGKFECSARYSLQGGAVFLDALCFDSVHWCDPAEFLLVSAIRLIERGIEESIREAGQ